MSNNIFDREQVEKDFRDMIPELSAAKGPSGFENEVVDLIRKYLSGVEAEVDEDFIHNLTFHMKGNKSSKKLLISAHTDEIGLIIRKIDSNGFLWFETLGGIAPQQFFGKHVVILTDKGHVDGIVQSIHPGRPDRCTTMPQGAGEFFIEIGAQSREEALEMGVEEGNAVSIDYPVINLGKYRIGGKALDDRALVFLLIELIKLLDKTDAKEYPDFYGLFSSQEEVGARGAIIAANRILPDEAIALDMSLACDIPKVSESVYINELGKGASIKVMDKLSTGIVGVISDADMVRKMKDICKDHGLNYQIEAYAAGATDASLIQTLGRGIRCGGVQIPMRYVHSYEVCDVRDVVDCLELLYSYVIS